MNSKEYLEIVEFLPKSVYPEPLRGSAQSKWNFKRKVDHFVFSDSAKLYMVSVKFNIN